VEVELGLDALDGSNDGVAGVVSSGATRADVGLSSEDVDKLALACGQSRRTEESKVKSVVWFSTAERGAKMRCRMERWVEESRRSVAVCRTQVGRVEGVGWNILAALSPVLGTWEGWEMGGKSTRLPTGRNESNQRLFGWKQDRERLTSPHCAPNTTSTVFEVDMVEFEEGDGD
jgi:hypothetical protein